MSTIAKRLREIADKCKRHRHQPPTSYEDGEELCRIAAELEAAPAADAVEVVAWMHSRAYGSGLSFPRPKDYTDEDGELVKPTALVRHRDHLSAIDHWQKRALEAEAQIAWLGPVGAPPAADHLRRLDLGDGDGRCHHPAQQPGA